MGVMRMRGRVPANYVGRYKSVFHGNNFQSLTMPLRKEATATRIQLCVRPTQACVRNAKKKPKVSTDGCNTEVIKALKENNDSLAAALGELLQATVLYMYIS